jgi:hypothetical protein
MEERKQEPEPRGREAVNGIRDNNVPNVFGGKVASRNEGEVAALLRRVPLGTLAGLLRSHEKRRPRGESGTREAVTYLVRRLEHGGT